MTTETMNARDALTRDQILGKLSDLAESRPGLDFANYGDGRAFRAESRQITRQLQDCRALLAQCAWRTETVTADVLRRQLTDRLMLREDGRLDYVTGQYYPVEFRAAVARALAGALWDGIRDSLPGSRGDYVRHQLRTLGRGILSRYFS